MAKEKTEELSEIAKLIAEAAKNRPVETFDVSGFFGLADRPVPRVGFRRPTKFEQDRAIAQAHEYVNGIGSTEQAKSDRDIVEDAKSACVAWEFCREVKEDPDNAGEWIPTGRPAFPYPKWMAEHMAPEQIAVLVNLGNIVRQRVAPQPIDVDDDTVEAYISIARVTDDGQSAFAGLPREYLAFLFVASSLKLDIARQELATAQQEIEELRACQQITPQSTSLSEQHSNS